MTETGGGINMQTFDGRQPIVPASEQLAVTTEMRGGIQALLGKHDDFVDTTITSHGQVARTIRLANTSGTEFRISHPGYPDHAGEIRVNDQESDGTRALVHHIYSPDEEGVIRRHDLDLGAIMRGDTFPGQTTTDLVSGEVRHRVANPQAVVHTFAERLEVYNQNRTTARDLGINEQPVSLAEMGSVLGAASNAEVPVVSGQQLDEAALKLQSGPVVSEADARAAAGVFHEAVERTLIREDAIVERTDTGVASIDEVTEYPTATWSVQVTNAGINGEADSTPFVGTRWTSNREPGVTEEITFRYGIDDDQFVVSREQILEKRVSPTISDTHIDVYERPGGVDDARLVRDFLRKRTLD